MKTFYFLLTNFLFLFSSISSAEPIDSWASPTLHSMTLDEKIGQLFMIAGYIDPEFAKNEVGRADIIQEIDHYIKDYHVGGIAYVGPSECCKQVTLTNHYQKISIYPLLIAQDLEWGLSMRHKDGLRFPQNITLGAIEDNYLIYKMGQEIGRQAKLIGVHMNLSPVLDVNIDPHNIVINVRSFGDSPLKVAEKGIAMIRGLQDAGIIASAKHFPGLGDITVDPHADQPCNTHSLKRLQEVELYPFAAAIKAGVLSIQTDHLIVPALEPQPHTPSSLSEYIVTDLLKNKMGFTGLVLSGALRMKALTKHFSEEEIVIRAFKAGSDMLLMPQDFPKAYQALKTAYDQKKISLQEIDERVLKILQLKEKVNLHKVRLIPLPTSDQLHSPDAKKLKQELYYNAVSLLRNEAKLIPLLNTQSIAYVQLGESTSQNYLEKLNGAFKLDTYLFPLTSKNIKEEERLFKSLDAYSLIILTVFPADPRRIAKIRLLNEQNQKEELELFNVHGITKPLANIIKQLSLHHKKIVITLFGNPFALPFFDNYSTLIMGYEDDPDAQKAAVSILCEQPN